MESVFVKNSPTLGELSVTISPQDYLPVFEKELKTIASKAHIKGFRPGKTPISVVRSMYGKAILADEINKLLSNAVNTYLQENNIDYLGELLPIDEEKTEFNLNAKETYTFKLQVATPSPFDLNLGSVSVQLYQPTISNEELEEVMQKNAERFAQEKEIDSVEDIFCTITGKAVWKEENEEGTEPVLQEQTCYLPVSMFFEEKQSTVLGAKVGDVLNLVPSKDLNLEDDGKKLTYIFGIFDENQKQKLQDQNIEITITAIHQRKPRELNQEFFEEIFPGQNVETLEQFREKIKELEENNIARNFAFFNEESIKDAVLEAHPFELPDEFLKNWLLRDNEKLTKELVEKEYPLASKDIRWSVIQRKIVKENEIKVEQNEINDYATNFILSQFRQYGLLNNPEFEKSMPNIVKNYLSADKGKNFVQIYNTLLNAKTMDFIKSKIQLEYSQIHWKELDALVKEHLEKKNASTTQNNEMSAV